MFAQNRPTLIERSDITPVFTTPSCSHVFQKPFRICFFFRFPLSLLLYQFRTILCRKIYGRWILFRRKTRFTLPVFYFLEFDSRGPFHVEE